VEREELNALMACIFVFFGCTYPHGRLTSISNVTNHEEISLSDRNRLAVDRHGARSEHKFAEHNKPVDNNAVRSDCVTIIDGPAEHNKSKLNAAIKHYGSAEFDDDAVEHHAAGPDDFAVIDDDAWHAGSKRITVVDNVAFEHPGSDDLAVIDDQPVFYDEPVFDHEPLEHDIARHLH
jgi:hypothetical protein